MYVFLFFPLHPTRLQNLGYDTPTDDTTVRQPEPNFVWSQLWTNFQVPNIFLFWSERTARFKIRLMNRNWHGILLVWMPYQCTERLKDCIHFSLSVSLSNPFLSLLYLYTYWHSDISLNPLLINSQLFKGESNSCWVFFFSCSSTAIVRLVLVLFFYRWHLLR